MNIYVVWFESPQEKRIDAVYSTREDAERHVRLFNHDYYTMGDFSYVIEGDIPLDEGVGSSDEGVLHRFVVSFYGTPDKLTGVDFLTYEDVGKSVEINAERDSDSWYREMEVRLDAEFPDVAIEVAKERLWSHLAQDSFLRLQ